MQESPDTPDAPAPATWWGAPGRGALRVALFMALAAWAAISYERALREHTQSDRFGVRADCLGSPAARAACVVLGVLGCGLLLWMLSTEAAQKRRQITALLVTFALWLLTVLVWLPGTSGSCG